MSIQIEAQANNSDLLWKASRMGASVFDPRKMELLESCEWIKNVRAHARRASIKLADDLFFYKHREGSFVLAVWVERPRSGGMGLMTPLLGFEDNPGDEGARCPPIKDIVANLQPDCAKIRRWRDEQQEKERRRVATRVAEAEYRVDIGKHIRDRHDDQLGRDIIAGRKALTLPET